MSKIIKRTVALVTVAMLMVTMVPHTAFAQTAVDTWNGTSDDGWYTATPAATEFTITTAEELAGLAEIVNAGTDTFEGKTITLTRNLDLAGTEWTPIGMYDSAAGNEKPFLGTFDGGNHSIKNMKIDRSSAVGYIDDSWGLFGIATDNGSKGAILENLSVLNVYVAVDSRIGGIAVDSRIGGLVGKIDYGEITNCHTSGEIIGGSFLGGLVGRAWEAEIHNSSSTANVDGENGMQNVGGLAGSVNEGKISNSYATGTVIGDSSVGGLVGSAGDTGAEIINCYALGDVTGGTTVGGLSGWTDGGTVKNSYATGTVIGRIFVGGLVGDTDDVNLLTNSYGNNANTVNDTGSNGNEYTAGKAGATLSEMQIGNFVGKLDPTGNVFGGDPNFNNGFPYLVTIPQIMSGDGQTIKQGETLIIKATFPYADGMGLTTKVDGIDVPAKYVVYSSGSTIATLSGEYTSSLLPGTYAIELATLDYGTVMTSFTVVAATSVIGPATGDHSNIYGLIAIATGSLLALSGLYLIAKKKNA